MAAGAEVIRPLTDTDYGSHEFSVRDPEGNIWSFGTYRPGQRWARRGLRELFDAT